MEQDDKTESWLVRSLALVGRGLATGGAVVGQQAKDLYRAVDPDVQRHLVQIPLLAYSLFSGRDAEIEAGEPDGHPPLVFVHGHGGNRGNFLLMSWLFRLTGRRRSFRIRFEGGHSVEEQAGALARFVRRVTKATGEKQVEMVAHSLGGVVARLAIQEHRLAGSVKTLVTLGAPHHGTYPARYANTVILRELRPDSGLVRRLNEKPVPRKVRVVTMWSRNDLFVLPAESALLDGAEQVDMTPFTHYSYLIDPRSFEAVQRALGS